MRKLKKEFINTKSEDYINYTIMVLWKFQLFPFFFLLALFFIIGSYTIYGDLSWGIFLLLLSAGCFYIGNKKTKFSFKRMIKTEVTCNIDPNFVQMIQGKRSQRIKAVIFCVKLIAWLISFLIIDSIADNVRGLLDLHTISDFIGITELLLASLILIFALQKIIYSVSRIIIGLIQKIKKLIRYFVYNGTFVADYIILTVIKNGLEEKLEEDRNLNR